MRVAKVEDASRIEQVRMHGTSISGFGQLARQQQSVTERISSLIRLSGQLVRQQPSVTILLNTTQYRYGHQSLENSLST